MVRPSKITPELIEEITGYIKAGNYPEVSASLAGIDRSTFYRWIKRGNESKTNGLYKQFCDSIKRAEDYAEAAGVERIRKAGDDNWQALAWWLERKHPKKWGRKERVEMEHSGELKQDITVTNKKGIERLKRIEAKHDDNDSRDDTI